MTRFLTVNELFNCYVTEPCVHTDNGTGVRERD